MQQRSNDVASRASAELLTETAAEDTNDSRLRFSSGGAKPPVMAGVEMAALSPSDRAYGARGGERDDDQEDDDKKPLSANGRIMERLAESDGAAIEEASKRYGIPEVDIIAVITQESRGVTTANAGASQRDHGAHAASGLMQVTEETWNHTTKTHSELSGFGFSSHRYVRRANILVGTAALADKRTALKNLGVPMSGPNATALTTMAFNAGEGIVSDAYHRAVRAGSRDPAEDCLRAEYLKPAIAKYPSVYRYYLTGGGKKRNPQRSVAKAIDLKFHEISKYPTGVELLIAEANAHELAITTDDEMMKDPTMLASLDTSNDDTA